MGVFGEYEGFLESCVVFLLFLNIILIRMFLVLVFVFLIIFIFLKK